MFFFFQKKNKNESNKTYMKLCNVKYTEFNIYIIEGYIFIRRPYNIILYDIFNDYFVSLSDVKL